MAHIQHTRLGRRLLKAAVSDQWYNQARSAHVAIVGSGPAGFYTAQHILKASRPILRQIILYPQFN